ncbi:MAG: serine/threonine protein kinase [Gemmataceae bacterium]
MIIDKIGSYETLGTLGRGASSTILHIRRRADGQEYALKIVSLEDDQERKFLEQAQHEYRIAQLLRHPNLIQVYALERRSDWLFRARQLRLLIEYVNGKTLNLLPRLPLAKLVGVFAQVADGLTHMHRKGIWHADLKPNNIMLGRDGVVKIIDYGLAQHRELAKRRVLGTPEYMAPETCQTGIVNARTDIFNFGATLYHLVTGQTPPRLIDDAGQPLPLTVATWQKRFQPVSSLNPQAPPELCALIERCLAQDPTKRPARVSELQGALDHLAEEMAGT